MAQYDGSIRINTEIQTRKAKIQLATLENRIVKTADKIASLRSKMDSLKDTKIPTSEYKNLEKEATSLEKKLLSLYDRQERFLETGGKESSTAYKRMVYDAEQLEKKLQYAEQAMQALVDSGKAFTLGSDTQEYANLGQQLKYAENEMDVLSQKHEAQSLKVEKTENDYKKLGSRAANALKKIGSMAKKHAISSIQRLGSTAKKAGSFIKGIASKLLGIGKSAKSASGGVSSMGMGFKNLLKYGLGIRSLYALVNKVRSAIKEGFSNMYNDSNMVAFKNTVDGLRASLLTLQNAFAVAFRPLVEIALPYIQMVVDVMTELLDKVGQFTAAITGQKSYTKAIKQTTAAIEDENKAQNKQLSGLDKLNNLSSGSGGSDGGASTQMFEENVPISDRFADIAQWFKDMWADADFSELGAVIGEKLKSALESIPWDSIKQTVLKVGKSFATLINGLVEVPGLALEIGKTIGEAINTGITGINSFLDSTHWDSIGKFIGDGLNGIVDSIDFSDIGHFFAEKWNALFETVSEAARTFDWINFGLELSNGVNTAISDFDWAENGARLGDLVKGILDTIINFFENTNWQELGENVAIFIGSIDWTGIFERLAEGIGAALGGLAAFLWGLIKDAWGSVVDWWNEVAFEDGQFTMKGLLNGIWEGIKNIGAWINEHIFKPFMDGFKKAFGIHSPSTVMEEQGNFIMQGLLNGILSLVDSVKEIWENMKKTAVNVWNSVKTSVSNIINNVKTTISTALSIIKATWTTAWTGMKNTVINIFNGIWTGIKSVINKILSGIESMANGVVNGINTVISALNGLSFDVPKWVPGIGGETFGFNIPELSSVSIPRLATGAVIPANKEFLAVLGDQKHGTNIEAPLATIEEAVENALSRHGGTGGVKELTIHVPFIVDGQVFYDLIKKYDLEHFSSTGEPSFQI